MTGNLADALGADFDARNVETTTTYELLPDGDYVCIIEDANMRDTASGGAMLVVEMVVLTGPNEGRKIIDRMNIVNKNETAVDIAKRQYAKLVVAIGKPTALDTEDLKNCRVIAVVKTEQGKGTYIAKDGTERPRGAQNVVKDYKPVTAAQAPAQAAASPAAKKRPWEK